jgi:aquaporin Z
MDVKDSVKDLLRRTSVEFMGTFYLVFFVGLTSQLTDSTSLQFVGAFVPGLTLMTLVFLGGHLSLGSYNPAVTLALTLRPALLSWRACLCYIVAELLGGIFGALTAWGFGGDVVP